MPLDERKGQERRSGNARLVDHSQLSVLIVEPGH